MNRHNPDFRLHLNAEQEMDPDVVVIRRKDNIVDVSSKKLFGRYMRVKPTTGVDVLFLQMLQHGVDKFAPTTGDGIIVPAEVIDIALEDVR